MPYIIYVPGNPRPFITNNPVVFMDARAWGWGAESRPYGDRFCNAICDQEDRRCEADKRDKELDRIWSGELHRRTALKVSISVTTEAKPKRGEIAITVEPVEAETPEDVAAKDEEIETPSIHGMPVEVSKDTRAQVAQPWFVTIAMVKGGINADQAVRLLRAPFAS